MQTCDIWGEVILESGKGYGVDMPTSAAREGKGGDDAPDPRRRADGMLLPYSGRGIHGQSPVQGVRPENRRVRIEAASPHHTTRPAVPPQLSLEAERATSAHAAVGLLVFSSKGSRRRGPHLGPSSIVAADLAIQIADLVDLPGRDGTASVSLFLLSADTGYPRVGIGAILSAGRFLVNALLLFSAIPMCRIDTAYRVHLMRGCGVAWPVPPDLLEDSASYPVYLCTRLGLEIADADADPPTVACDTTG
ncbi:hypothetical protein JHW43_006505 [Diplocarpon mali]|nr:hypothetical protein JHW43_006505 [Diplocarpon mali]